MNYEGRLNAYLHRPVQVLALDADEVKIIALLFIGAMVFGGTLLWGAFFFGPFVLIPYKRDQARGFFNHSLIFVGATPLFGYPPNNIDAFYE
jgi:hypothetical protein